MQEKYLKEISETLKECEIIKVTMYDREIKGINMIIEIGSTVF